MLYFEQRSALQEIRNEQIPIFKVSVGDSVFSRQIAVGFVLKAQTSQNRDQTNLGVL